MKRIGIQNSNAFILVYSIDDADSFEEVRRLRELIWDIKLERHIAKYSSVTNNSKQPTPGPLLKNDPFVKKETNSIANPVKQVDLKLGQRRHSLNNQFNGTHLNARLNGQLNVQLNGQIRLNNTFSNQLSNQLNSPLNSPLNNQINNQINNRLTNQHTKRHHHHHHRNASANDKKTHKKPYIVTNINQRYKLSENLKLISERRKSLTNSTKIGELKSKLGDISETINDVAHQPTTADILCLRPSKLQTNSLPVYSTLFEKQEQQTLGERNADDIPDEESNNIRSTTNRGRRRSSFLLSPDSLSSESGSSDSECESANCDESGCSSSSSCCSLNNLNLKLDHKDKENKTNNFEQINNLNNYKSKLESKKEQERLLFNDDIPPFEPPVIVVVGNKCDLECKRAVNNDLAENIVQIDWDNGFIECSAKNNFNMTAIFKEMLKQSKLPFVVSNALDSQKNRRRSLPAYPSNGIYLKEPPTFRTKRNSCALS